MTDVPPLLARRFGASVQQTVRGLPAAFWTLWVGSLINKLGTFVVPFLALYLTEQRHLAVEQAGGIVALYGAGGIFSGPVGGQLADRFGRRGTLLLGLFAGGTAMLLLAAMRSPAAIAIATLVLGFTSELFRPAMMALLADVVAPRDRPRAFTLLYWAANVGFSIAPVIAGFMAKAGFLWLFLADAATTYVYALIVLWKIREPEHTAAPVAEGPFAFAVAFTDGVFMSFFALTVAIAMLFFQHLVTLPVAMKSHGASSEQFGMVLAVNGLLIVLFQPWVVRLTSGASRARLLAFASAVTGAGFALYAWVHTVPLYALGVAVWTVGEIVMSPIGPSLVADLSPAHARGRYQGAYAMAWSTAAFLGPWLGGGVMQRWGEAAVWKGCGAVGLATGALHLIVAPARRRRLATLSARSADD